MEPYTDREGLRQQYAQARDMLLAAPPPVAARYLLRSTSGTSQDAPLHIVLTLEDAVMARFGGSVRVFGAVGTMNMRLLNTLFVRYGSVPRQKIFFTTMSDVGPALAPLVDDFAPDLFYGFLSFVLFVLSRTDSAALRAVPLLLISGEYLTEVQQKLLTAACPRARIFQIYSTSETASVSLDFSEHACTHLAANAYHIRSGVELDIIDQGADGVGDVVLSWNLLGGLRVSRYNIGDSGKMVHEPCPCGEQSRLELLGRSGYDYLKLVGAILRKEEFDRVASLCRGLVDEYRAEAYMVQQMERLLGGVELTVYRASGPLTEEEKILLAQKFSSALFVTPTQTYERLVDKNIFVPLTIRQAPAAFPKTGKEVTLKMRR